MNSMVIVPLDAEHVAFVNGPTYTREEILRVMSSQNSKEEKNHTPTPVNINCIPWHVEADDRLGDILVDCEGDTANVNDYAAFIVKAVNCHEELVNHLKIACQLIENVDTKGINYIAGFKETITKAEAK